MGVVDAVRATTAQRGTEPLAGVTQQCGGSDRLGDVPFRQMATLEIRPGELLVKNGFPFPKPGSTMIT